MHELILNKHTNNLSTNFLTQPLLTKPTLPPIVPPFLLLPSVQYPLHTLPVIISCILKPAYYVKLNVS